MYVFSYDIKDQRNALGGENSSGDVTRWQGRGRGLHVPSDGSDKLRFPRHSADVYALLFCGTSGTWDPLGSVVCSKKSVKHIQ